MRNFLKDRKIELTAAIGVFTVMTASPALAGPGLPVPGPALGILAGGAVIGVLLVAKWKRGL